MLNAETADNGSNMLKSVLKILTFDKLQGEKRGGIFVHPRTAESLIPGDCQPVKKFSAILPDVEKLLKHGHIQRFAEAARPRDERDHRRRLREQFLQEHRLINIVAVVFPDASERFAANEDIGS